MHLRGTTILFYLVITYELGIIGLEIRLVYLIY